jgi:hypothetical protein
MPTLRDIPTDVIQFVLFPFLDPMSGFIANETLAPSKEIEYRIVKRIPKDQIIAHGMMLELNQMVPLLSYGDYLCPESQIKIFTKLLRGQSDLLMQYNRSYRRVVDEKMAYFLNDETYPANYNKGFKKGLQSLASKINDRLKHLPFVKHITTKRMKLQCQ